MAFRFAKRFAPKPQNVKAKWVSYVRGSSQRALSWTRPAASCVIQERTTKSVNMAMSGLSLSNSLNSSHSFSTSATEEVEKRDMWSGLMEKHGNEAINAPDGYNRWRVVPYAVSKMMCLGALYAWSILNKPLTRELGGVCSSSADWTLPQVMAPFTLMVLSQGLFMAFSGKWVERVGPRITGAIGSVLYGGGMLVGGAGVAMHSLPLMYTGFGALCGPGLGLCYLAPIGTLVRWFPDRRGLATGMAICGFGGGAIVVAQMKKKLLATFEQMPTFLGPMSDVPTKFEAESGRLLTESNGKWVEVVNATRTALDALGSGASAKMEEGLYLVGSGNTGAAATLGVLGTIYFGTCMTGSMLVKTPKADWLPDSMKKTVVEEGADEAAAAAPKMDIVMPKNVHIDDVMKTKQFWLQWVTLLSTATVGMGLMSCAKDVMDSCFAGSAAFAATYVQLLSLANLSGRLAWSSASDTVGRKNIFALYTLGGAPLCLALPYVVHSGLDAASNAPMFMFCGSTMLIISFFGAGYSTIPAYESDIFGTKYIAAIHGRMMTASAVAGVAGPIAFGKLRQSQERGAMEDLCTKVDAAKFAETFGAGKDQLATLMDSKAVSISKLMDLVPAGTVDPSPFLYDPAFRAMGGVFAVGAIANMLIRPVNPKWLEENRGKDMSEAK